MNHPVEPGRRTALTGAAGKPRAAVAIAPADVHELAACVQQANRDGLKIAIEGARVTAADIVLSLRQLRLPIDHCAGDLVATVAAGALLSDVNSTLRVGGQWLALDPPNADRAIGAIVAANDSGPRRHRHGTPRDLILGVEMVLADGRLARAGGRVVKNVAGYDLARLLCGSRGSLAIIVGATFKLAPLPAASRTAVLSLTSGSTLSELVRLVAAAPLTPSAIELDAPPYRLLVRFETTAASADRQATAVAEIGARLGAACAIVADHEEGLLWSRLREQARGLGTLLEIHVLPTDLAPMLEELTAAAAPHRVDWNASGRAALGILLVRLSGQGQFHTAIAARLRAKAVGGGGSLVVHAIDETADPTFDRWGSLGDTLALARAVKSRFDPKETLNPGAAPGGL